MSGRRQDDCDVLVIGGGLTGLTCAVLLHEAGHSVIVVEAFPLPHTFPQATSGQSHIQPRSGSEILPLTHSSKPHPCLLL